MTEHAAPAEKDVLARAVAEARDGLNETPWWQPFKRQRLSREYRYALMFAALAGAPIPPGSRGGDQSSNTEPNS